jgi:hypothetical protein
LHTTGELYERFFASMRKEVLSQPREDLETKALSTMGHVMGHQ